MATYYLCPFAAFLQLFSDVGIPLSGALIWTYQAGTSTPTPTWTDSTGAVQNANPIQLNSAGRLPNVSIWQASGVPIKVVFSTNAGTSGAPVFGSQIGPTFDQISGINDFAAANSSLANPASGSGADLVANAVRSYDVFATARSANTPVLASGQTLIVAFEGGVSITDGLGGLFYWNATSSAADDGINIIKPTALSGAGRYLRVLPLQIEWTATKAAATSRSSNTTPAADPDLQITLPTGGTYAIEGWINDAGGTSAGGLKGTIAFSGTSTSGSWGMVGSGTGTTAVPLTALGTSVQMQSAQTGVGSMRLDAALLCSTGGTLSFNWAQQGSNGTASQVSSGSYLRVTRLSSATGGFNPTTSTYSTPGTFTESIPSGATTMEIEVNGGSAGGGNGSGTGCGAHGGGGGGAGGYSKTILNVAVANGQTISVTVGAAGSTAGSGGASSVSSGSFALTTMTANGGSPGVSGGLGTGGTGGTASGGNTTNTTGSSGSTGGAGNPGGSGGGGHVGDFVTGSTGGTGGNDATHPGAAGGAGKIAFHYT